MKREDQIDWWTWISEGAPQLSAMVDMPPKTIPRLREQKTGLRKPLLPHWVKMVGRWGGQMTCEEIARFVGVPSRNVRSYAQHWNVGFRKKAGPPKLQVEVALDAYTVSARGAPEDVALHARQCHILPPELLHYREHIPFFEALMSKTHGVTLRELVSDYTMEAVQDFWVASGCFLQPPGSSDRVKRSKPSALERLRRK